MRGVLADASKPLPIGCMAVPWKTSARNIYADNFLAICSHQVLHEVARPAAKVMYLGGKAQLPTDPPMQAGLYLLVEIIFQNIVTHLGLTT